ncbi:MAG TPA: SpvB/TcaC N-terminal domain-containing protein [Parafilimonas sp.]|nr:SpvB/TcaC N-terminal domain-containing protein [Parafilimonas sp.]
MIKNYTFLFCSVILIAAAFIIKEPYTNFFDSAYKNYKDSNLLKNYNNGPEEKENIDSITYSKSNKKLFVADINTGFIGTNDNHPVDDPSDNIFHIYLPDISEQHDIACLQYELFGFKDQASVARSINDAQAIGGIFAEPGGYWSKQKEAIPVGNLHKGDNIIRFDLAENAKFYYRLKNISILLEKKEEKAKDIIINNARFISNDSTLYIKGIIQTNKEGGNAKLFYNGNPVNIFNNEFEIVSHDTNAHVFNNKLCLELKAIFTGGKTITRQIKLNAEATTGIKYLPLEKGITSTGFFERGKQLTVDMNAISMKASIVIPPNALTENKFISITALRDIDLPELNPDMVNVTSGAKGFRFLPHGTKFTTAAQMNIPFDSSLIPEGYTAADIRTYYFDENLKQWIDLPVDTILTKDEMVRSNTIHFTDVINGIIKVPESPQTQGYTPTTIKDIKAANPSAGINFIEPPKANNNGNASLSYPLKIPKGRQGMEPQLTVQYNSEGGNSWMGLGWNLSIPFVGIETRWGVPRYDPDFESEMYNLNGEQLAPTNNRTPFVARVVDKRDFHPRVEGEFNRIMRHGNSPKNYWWEVTAKNGTRSFYGGTPANGVISGAVLKDDEGNIGQWMLAETRDLNNNFVKYEYKEVNDAGVSGGTVQGRQLYINKILYTGNGSSNGPYAIEFIRDRDRNESKRRDIDINCRLGFKVVSTDLLRIIKMSVDGQAIRSYEFKYTPGAFYKTLLTSITESDAAGKTFYSHSFEYNDDVKSKSGYVPFGNTEKWNPGNDNINGDNVFSLPDYKDDASVLSSTKSSNFGGGLGITIGPAGSTYTKDYTLGGTFGYSEDNSQGLVTMLDIDGDRLPDKVFVGNNNILWYRKNLGGNSRSFSDSLISINGITNFSESNSRSISWGVQAIGGGGNFGYTKTKSTNRTSVYFNDFNEDGLIDIASHGSVYFNRIGASGNAQFLLGSQNTPNPLNGGKDINENFLTPDKDLQAEQETQFPLQDIVRFWEAPFEGEISIDAPVNLEDVPDTIKNSKRDGIRATMQIGSDDPRFIKVIEADNHAVYPYSDKFRIHKGQRLYFRVESRYNGDGDLVKWDPVIRYLQIFGTHPTKDADNRLTDYYKASEDYYLHAAGGITFPQNGKIIINGKFIKKHTSDSVRLIIRKKINTKFDTIYNSLFTPGFIYNDSLKPFPFEKPLDVTPSDTLFFYVKCDSHIDRAAVTWQPHFQYIKFSDPNIPDTNQYGKPLIEGNIIPDNSNYNNWIVKTPTLIAEDVKDPWEVRPLFIDRQIGPTGDLTLTVKGTDTIYGKRFIKLVNGAMQNADKIKTIIFTPKEGEQIFCEYQSDSSYIPEGLIDTDDEFYSGIYVRVNGGSKGAGFYTTPKEDFMGTLYRGWGLFSFKGDTENKPLDESKLNLDELSKYESDPDKFQDTSKVDEISDPSKADFQPMYADAGKQYWKGNDSSVYIDSEFMSSSRLWLHDVSVDKLMETSSIPTVDKISTSSSKSYSGGFSYYGFGLNASTSETDTKTTLDAMDMNADGYADIINENSIQYTLPSGGLDEKTIPYKVGANTSSATSSSISADPNPAPAKTKMLNTAIASVMAALNAKASISASSGKTPGSNNDKTKSSFMDMNGDGLADKVYDDGKVALNLGYSFADPENWPFDDIESNVTTSSHEGIGVSLVSGSVQGGYSLTKSSTNNNASFTDINGDGLPDKCTDNGFYIKVQLNTGVSFGSAVTYDEVSSINTNESVGESINGAFTIGFNIFFIRICINPSLSGGHSISRRQDQIMDIDGDGFPDILHSARDGDLTVKRSLIGRTNMLVKVTRPMGSYFTMDYERMGNTYDMPQSKWVLKNVEMFDGLKGDGVDTTRKEFSYEGGLYDRRERDFYGFKKVTTKELNTPQNNTPYRIYVQQFSTENYYYKGLLTSEWMEDANGNKFTQTNNFYALHNVAESVFFPALKKTEQLYHEGKPVAAVKTSQAFEYDALGNMTSLNDAGDGSQQDMLKATITYHSDDALYIKSTPESITVTDVDGTVLRNRLTKIDSKGNIILIKKFLADGTSADYNMQYDAYGNLSEIQRPENDSGQRMTYTYTYDNSTHTYVTEITDAFDYKSTSAYDLRFGIDTSTVSINKQPMRYKLDDKGRISTITGPYEIEAGKPYTIAFEYYPDATVPYAISRHYDPEYNDDIKTITFMDGIGRAIQVKKQVSVFAGKDKEDSLKMVVSGRQLFDCFGRATATYYPVTELIGASNNSFNTSFGLIQSKSTYDVLDRTLHTQLTDGATTSYIYDAADNLFTTTITDPNNNTTQTTTDIKERKRESKLFKPNGVITTSFYYNAVSELLKVIDTKGNTTEYTYDNLGRKLSMNHPDNGLTTFTYDLAGNMTTKTTAEIRKEIPNGGAIVYRYQYERLTDIDYPRYYQNKVTYIYGDSSKGIRAGRLILQEDASGGQEFFYGKLGEVTKTIRTVMISPVNITTYISEEEYDTWNRIKKMVYPDGEVVTYHYNKGGSLQSMDGLKSDNIYKYVDRIGYDEYEQRKYLKYGNGTETNYSYDSARRRLVLLTAQTKGGRQFMNNTYKYDAVSNILGIENNVGADSGKLGGYSKQDYGYDNLYRLVSATGVYRGYDTTAGYTLAMKYDDLYNITGKSMVDSVPWKSYDLDYDYSGSAPHQPVKIKGQEYRYDANGNLLGNDSTDYYWDEENRLRAVVSNGILSQYTYDAGGERAVKSSNPFQDVWLNGAPAGSIIHDDNYTAYVSPYLVCRKFTFTKHYYIETERIVSKPGNGRFINTAFPSSGLTAGNVDYRKRMDSIEKARTAWYAKQGISPGPPTDKNYWGRPEVNGIQPPVIVDNSANDAPPDWPHPDSIPQGIPVILRHISRDSAHGGYGFDEGMGAVYEKDQYFYHHDHLGSTSFVSDALGELNQHAEYSAFGETFFEERKGDFASPYLFNAKERDAETGLYYYGARYYDPKISLWASVDPMVEKYIAYSPYNYCLNNPVKYLDSNGSDFEDGNFNYNQALSNYMNNFFNYVGDQVNNAIDKISTGNLDNPDLASNICGSKEGFNSEIFVPDYPNPNPLINVPLSELNAVGLWSGALNEELKGGLDFTSACQYHDNCYGSYGVTQEFCDNKLYEIAVQKNGPEAIPMAYIYKTVLSKQGETAFKAAQEKAPIDLNNKYYMEMKSIEKIQK